MVDKEKIIFEVIALISSIVLAGLSAFIATNFFFSGGKNVEILFLPQAKIDELSTKIVNLGVSIGILFFILINMMFFIIRFLKSRKRSEEK